MKSNVLQIRVSEDLKKQLQEKAKLEDESLSSCIRRLLREWVKNK